MCIATPGKVIQIDEKSVIVEYFNHHTQKAVIADIVPSLYDPVLVQMGIVIKVLDKKEVQTAEDSWKETELK